MKCNKIAIQSDNQASLLWFRRRLTLILSPEFSQLGLGDYNFYASAGAIAMAGGNMFSGCLSICPIFVNVISQERLEGISLNLVQTSTWTQG